MEQYGSLLIKHHPHTVMLVSLSSEAFQEVAVALRTSMLLSCVEATASHNHLGYKCPQLRKKYRRKDSIHHSIHYKNSSNEEAPGVQPGHCKLPTALGDTSQWCLHITAQSKLPVGPTHVYRIGPVLSQKCCTAHLCQRKWYRGNVQQPPVSCPCAGQVQPVQEVF